MFKRTENRRLLCVLLSLAMVLSFAITAMAQGSATLPSYDASVTSITLNGTDISSFDPYDEELEGHTAARPKHKFVYNVLLPANTPSNATFSIDFTKASGIIISPASPEDFLPQIIYNASDTYNITLNNGVASQTVYVYKGINPPPPNIFLDYHDIYIFNFSIGAHNNPVEASNGLKLRFGDHRYPSTEPECYMSIDSISGGYRVNYNGPYGNTTNIPSGQPLPYYPDTLAFFVTEGKDDITAMNGTGMILTVYDENGDVLESGSSLTSNKNAGYYVITLAENASSRELTITTAAGNAKLNFLEPTPYIVPATGSPDFMNGYLPVGQFVTGAGWGGAYASGNNAAGNVANTNPNTTADAPTKVTSGYVSTGMSLGAPGGYVQFEFSNPVLNRAENPFGIDFVVYGNPFVGNPEAAAVKVSQDGNTWYELAGSRYYNSETKRNTTISYKMIPAASYGNDKRADIYYAIGTPPSGSGAAGWTLFKSGVTWWPESVSEGYGRVSGVTDILDGTVTCNGITYQVLSEQANGHNCWQITYNNVTLVKDTDNTDDYLFGYADVRHVGDNTTGTPCNPYASLPSSGTGTMNGGDGFDISWAVNASGEPVPLNSINFVRIYTAAALDPNNLDALAVPGIFGETSAEVCGVSVATGTGSGVATTPPTIKKGPTTITTNHMGSQNVNAGPYRVKSSAENIYLNGNKINAASWYTFEVVSGKTYQIITQNGTEQPYITVLKGI